MTTEEKDSLWLSVCKACVGFSYAFAIVVTKSSWLDHEIIVFVSLNTVFVEKLRNDLRNSLIVNSVL